MYGQVAHVCYEGEIYELFITCTYRDKPEDLSRMGLYRLETLIKEHPELPVQEIVNLVNTEKL